MGADWSERVAQMEKLLHRGDEILQMMQVTGEEGISVEDFIVWQKAMLLDMVYLQQDAFDEVDISMPRERQVESFAMLKRLIKREYAFSEKEAARDFFTRLTGLYKNFNYSPYQSQEYQRYKDEIDKIAGTPVSAS